MSDQPKSEDEKTREEGVQKAQYMFSEDFLLRKRVVEILNRAGKYVLGYLPEQPIEMEKDYGGDPLILTIKVTVNVDRSERTVKQETYAPEASR